MYTDYLNKNKLIDPLKECDEDERKMKHYFIKKPPIIAKTGDHEPETQNDSKT